MSKWRKMRLLQSPLCVSELCSIVLCLKMEFLGWEDWRLCGHFGVTKLHTGILVKNPPPYSTLFINVTSETIYLPAFSSQKLKLTKTFEQKSHQKIINNRKDRSMNKSLNNSRQQKASLRRTKNKQHTKTDSMYGLLACKKSIQIWFTNKPQISLWFQSIIHLIAVIIPICGWENLADFWPVSAQHSLQWTTHR